MSLALHPMIHEQIIISRKRRDHLETMVQGRYTATAATSTYATYRQAGAQRHALLLQTDGKILNH